MSKDNCPICGMPWVGHDFGVPYPICPDTQKDKENEN
jgi:uncharacterized Zn finger protein (UPF0148 family)